MRNGLDYFNVGQRLGRMADPYTAVIQRKKKENVACYENHRLCNLLLLPLIQSILFGVMKKKMKEAVFN